MRVIIRIIGMFTSCLLLSGCGDDGAMTNFLIGGTGLKPYQYSAIQGGQTAYIKNMNETDSVMDLSIFRQFSRMAYVDNKTCQSATLFPRGMLYYPIPAGKAVTIVAYYEKTFGSEAEGHSFACGPLAMTFTPKPGAKYSFSISRSNDYQISRCTFRITNQANQKLVSFSPRPFSDPNTTDMSYTGPRLIVAGGKCPELKATDAYNEEYTVQSVERIASMPIN